MVLSSEQVSREHAVVRLIGDNLEIEELSSRNGTRVNSRIIEATRHLDAGDVIEIAGERIEVLRRVSRDQSATVQGEPPEDPTVKAQRNILELVEELTARAAETREKESLVRTIHELVDTLVRTAQRSGRRLTRPEAVRLVSITRVVAGWSPDTSLVDWSQSVARTVGQM
jgi:hypothetical protein